MTEEEGGSLVASWPVVGTHVSVAVTVPVVLASR